MEEERKNSGFIYFPIIYSTPETGFAVGSAVGYYYRNPHSDPDSRPSTITPIFIYTQKKQIMTRLNLDLYMKDELYRLFVDIKYYKYPDKFYGIGNDLPKSNKEDFTSRRSLILLDFQRRVSPGLNLGLQYEFGHSRVIKVEDPGLLSSGGIPGSTGGTVSGAGIIINRDTRNHIFYPTSGSWNQTSARFYGSSLGSDFSYSQYILDNRHYEQIFPNHIVASQIYVNVMTGTPPFEMMSRLGGENMMRGYYQGRYSDKCMIAIQSEYRMHLWRRLGLVGFAGVGDVSDKFSNFRLNEFKTACGLGLRFLFSPEEKINLRLDFASGKGTSGMYISIQEAF
jgi:outer membrane protein assembly factor BamA